MWGLEGGVGALVEEDYGTFIRKGGRREREF
jgi:hypothetical protein